MQQSFLVSYQFLHDMQMVISYIENATLVLIDVYFPV